MISCGRSHALKCHRYIRPVFVNQNVQLLSQAHAYCTSSDVTVLPRKKKIVICGSGIVGCSIAYHLTHAGEADVLLIDKGSIGEGATSYSAGIVGQLKGTSAETAMVQYSVDLYKSLSIKHNLDWRESGTLFLARTSDRLHHYNRNHQTAMCHGVKTQMLTQEEVLSKHPYINGDSLKGALWIPEDIIIDTMRMTKLLAKLAVGKGATVIENCMVTKVMAEKRRVQAVETTLGDVECDYFINAAGQWARMIGKLSSPRVRVPIHSVEHYYLLAKPRETLDTTMPVIRDYDNHCYFRAWGDSVMAGAFEETAKPIFHDGVPDNFICNKSRLPEDWDHLQFMLDKVLHVIPGMSKAIIEDVVTGSEAFTPDRHWMVGQTPELANYYLAAGFCGAGLAAAGGVGKKMSELVLKGKHIDWHDAIDTKRFVDLHNNIKYLRARVREVVGFEYGASNVRPEKRFQTARMLRVSPLYTREEKAGAVFGESVGFERALYFTSNSLEQDYQLNMRETSFGKPSYFDIVRTEYWGCRENVCLIDMSSFAKTEIRADNCDELVRYLQYMCANDVGRPVGSVIHSGMLNKNGGYENDCSLFRMDENRYLVVSPASQQTRSIWWLRENLPSDSTVQISDVTSMYSVINLIGPKARELLAELTDVSLKVIDFPHMTGKTIYVANAGGIIAMRLTHAGEDGFILYIPSEYALHVYDSLMAVGKDYGIRNAGYYALRSLRTEKLFAYWGTDLNSNVTPFECARDHRVKLASGIEFLGRDALLKQRVEGIKKKFVMFTLEDLDENRDNFAWKGEPIFRNGQYVGNVSSSAYGYTLKRLVCLGFIRNANGGVVSANYITDRSAKYEIGIGSKRFSAKPYAYPPKIEAANLGFYLPAQKAH